MSQTLHQIENIKNRKFVALLDLAGKFRAVAQKHGAIPAVDGDGYADEIVELLENAYQRGAQDMTKALRERMFR